jgi:alkylation response protein AidB-like acyl-CoA dehydrogenase
MSRHRPPLKESLFLLNHVIDWQQIFDLPEFAHVDVDLASAVLTEAAKFVTEVVEPINKIGDEQGSVLIDGQVQTADGFKDAYKHFAEGGWAGLDLPEQYGGQNLPLTVQLAFADMLNGACLSFSMLPIMLRAASCLLIEHGESELVGKIVPKLAAGEWGASICITEPQAGSDVGRIRSVAHVQEDGGYRLSGNKIFISYGDHDLTSQIIHMVLARTSDAPSGTQGISLFVVPKLSFETGESNGVSVSRLEKKMGLKASPTCVMNFDEAVAYRIGPEHRGLQCMFTMVNLMRLEVSIQGPAVASAAIDKALRYAEERAQGGSPDQPALSIIEHADIRRMLLSMRSRTEAMRALVYETAFYLDMSRHAQTETEAMEARRLAEFLLPVCKAYGSETGFDVANMAIQILGGHGYVSDAGVEQHVRDVRVAAIYEGSNGIQALDLVSRKLIKDSGARYQLLVKRFELDILESADFNEVDDIRNTLKDGMVILQDCSSYLLDDGRSRLDIESGATDYLQLVGLLAGAWMSLRIAVAVLKNRKELQKLDFAKYYCQDLMPKAMLFQKRIKIGAGVLDDITKETLLEW